MKYVSCPKIGDTMQNSVHCIDGGLSKAIIKTQLLRTAYQKQPSFNALSTGTMHSNSWHLQLTRYHSCKNFAVRNNFLQLNFNYCI